MDNKDSSENFHSFKFVRPETEVVNYTKKSFKLICIMSVRIISSLLELIIWWNQISTDKEFFIWSWILISEEKA